MSFEVMQWVLNHSRAKGAARLVLIVIADQANDDGTESWPSHATLARKANTSPNNVRKAVRSLEQLGELRTEINAGGSADRRYDRRPNRYTVLMNHGGSKEHPRENHGESKTPPRGIKSAQHGESKRYPKQSLELSLEQPVLMLAASPPPPEPPDPIKVVAHGLAVLAYEQEIKPVTAKGFPTVLARITAELKAGETPEAIRAAILLGDITWTGNGLRTAIGRAKREANQGAKTRGGSRTAFVKERLRELHDERRNNVATTDVPSEYMAELPATNGPGGNSS